MTIPAAQMLISGTGAGIDLEDMRANVQYAGGYHEEHPLVLNFWKARLLCNHDDTGSRFPVVSGSRSRNDDRSN